MQMTVVNRNDWLNWATGEEQSEKVTQKSQRLNFAVRTAQIETKMFIRFLATCKQILHRVELRDLYFISSP